MLIVNARYDLGVATDDLRRRDATAWLEEKLTRVRRGVDLCTVQVEGQELPYDPAAALAAAQTAVLEVNANPGTTLLEQLRAHTKLPPEVVADALMLEKSGLSEDWFNVHWLDCRSHVLIQRVAGRLTREVAENNARAFIQSSLDAERPLSTRWAYRP